MSAVFTAPVVDADPNAPLLWMATSYVPGPTLAGRVAAAWVELAAQAADELTSARAPTC
ncbi:hypothetical protein AB0I02_22115 [Streptomyces phaeochromogenes]